MNSQKFLKDLNEELFKFCKYSFSSIVILTHKYADVDALASVYAIYRLIKLIKPNANVKMVFPNGLNLTAKRIAEKFNVEVSFESFNLEDFKTIVIVDTASLGMLAQYSSKILHLNKDLIIIDHHSLDNDIVENALITICDPTAQSCSEIIVKIYEELNVNIPLEVGSLLIAGIISDTSRFQRASPLTFKSTLSLIKAGVNYNAVLELLHEPLSNSERIARLKACQRISINRIENYIVVTTYIGAYESSVANILISLGADVAIVANKLDKDKIRICARCSEKFYENTSLSLSRDLMDPIGRMFNGYGGGHNLAACAEVFSDNVENILKLCVLTIEKLIKRDQYK
ncbi:MAG: DHH family phosphoesterase [Candidatus Methanomethylicia archaeon]